MYRSTKKPSRPTVDTSRRRVFRAGLSLVILALAAGCGSRYQMHRYFPCEIPPTDYEIYELVLLGPNRKAGSERRVFKETHLDMNEERATPWPLGKTVYEPLLTWELEELLNTELVYVGADTRASFIEVNRTPCDLDPERLRSRGLVADELGTHVSRVGYSQDGTEALVRVYGAWRDHTSYIQGREFLVLRNHGGIWMVIETHPPRPPKRPPPIRAHVPLTAPAGTPATVR